ncbi:MAG: Mu transposase C-terminal domain-containing protein [Pyrinomonadaceae bacterium]
MQLTLRGREYVVEKRLPDKKIRIKDILTDQRIAICEEELADALFAREAELLGHGRNQDALKERLSKTKVTDIACLKDDDPRKKELYRRIAYVEAVQAARLEKRTKETLQPIIDDVAAKISESNPPSVSTLCRWLRFFDQSGGDSRALVPATKARGNRTRRFLGRRAAVGDIKNNVRAQERAVKVAMLLDETIDEVYLKDQRFTVQAVYDALVVKIDDANRFRDADDKLPLVDKSSVYDAVNKLDDYDVVEARFGKKIANEKYHAIGQGPRPTRPLERVEGDHTTTNVLVIDPRDWLPLGRLYLTWLICCYTKMILGFYMSFNPPSYLTIMEALKHAIRPKTYVKGKYPNIRNEWNPYGLPEVLVVDNAREFHGRNLEDACHQLGIVLQYSQRGKPWFRPSVERSYRTLATELHHQLPGTTFSNIFERGDYEPGKTAIVTPDTLDEVTHKWIADIYQVSPHRGIRDVPALRWQKGIAQWPPALPANAELLDVTLGYTEERVVSHRGIELDHLFYNDDDLALVRRTMDSRKKVIIKRNPSDLSLIHAYDEKHDKYIPVPAVDQEYTRGLTLYQHAVITRYVREQLKRNVDIVALARAKSEVQDIVKREWLAAGAKGKTRARLARLRGEGIQKREAIELPNADDNTRKSRVLGPSKPHLMLTAGTESLADRSSDIGNSHQASSDVTTKPEPNLKLVKSDEEAALEVSDGKSKQSKACRSSNGKKKPSSKRVAKKAKRVLKNTSISSAAESVSEDLDMTGWSGDYNLAK